MGPFAVGLRESFGARVTHKTVDLAAREFHFPACRLQLVKDLLPMIPLDFDDTVFDGATGPTLLLEPLAKCLEFGPRQGHIGDHGHALAPSTFGLTTYSNNSIADLWHLGVLASTRSLGLATARAHPAMFRRVHQSRWV